jgi:hypothetical protein
LNNIRTFFLLIGFSEKGIVLNAGEIIYNSTHENGSQRVVALSLKEFIKGWYNGEISI